MLPTSSATLSVAAGTEGDTEGPSRCPHCPTLCCSPRRVPPLLDGISPYSWSGLPGSGESAKRAVVATAPSTAMGRCHHLHLPPSPSCQGAPEAKSRGPGAAQSGVRKRGLMGLRGFAAPWVLQGGERGMQRLPSPISTSTSWLHSSWKRLNTRQEYVPRSAVVTSCTCGGWRAGATTLPHAVLCCPTPCSAAPHRALLPHAVPRCATQCQTRGLQYLELWCSRTLHGAPVPEPLVLRRRVAEGSALQHQRVPLGQAARPWLLQDLQPRHAGAVTAGCGWEGQQISTRPWQGCTQLASAPQCPAGATHSPIGEQCPTEAIPSPRGQ